MLLIPSARRKTQWNLYLTRRNEICTPLNRPDFSPNLSGKRGKAFRFTNAWEQRKLGELSDIIGGGTPSTGNSTYWDGNINWYSPAEISNQIFLSASQRKISELGYSSCSAKILPKGTVLFTSRAGIGKTAILAEEGCTNQGFQSIVPHTNELDSYFIFSRTSELKKYGEVVGAGSTFVEVSGKQMAAMTLMMPPSINEQKVIGSFFKRLDTLLTLHQRQQNGGYLWLENSAKQVCFAIITASGYRSTKKALSDQLPKFPLC